MIDNNRNCQWWIVEAIHEGLCTYDKLAHPLPDMHKQTVHVVAAAVHARRQAYLLVNNRSEGNAPLTIQALTELLKTEG